MVLYGKAGGRGGSLKPGHEAPAQPHFLLRLCFLSVGGATSRRVVMGSIKRQAEQAMGSKPGSSTAPWPLYRSFFQVPALLEFLS